MLEAAGLVVLGFVVGGYGTVIGAGGGFILVPLLLFIYPHYQPEEVTSISLAVVFANATSGSAAYARQRRIDYRTGLLFAVASAPGVIAGALAVGYLPKRAFSTLFGLMLLGLAAVSLRGPSMTIRAPLRGPGVLMRTMTDLEGEQVVDVGDIPGVDQHRRLSAPEYRPARDADRRPARHAVVLSRGGREEGSVGRERIEVRDRIPGVVDARIVQRLDYPQYYIEVDQSKAAALGLGAIPGAQVGALLAHRIRGRTVLLLLSVAIVALGIRLLLSGLFDV